MRRVEIETADQWIGELPARPGEADAALFIRAEAWVTRLAREFRRPRGAVVARYPADLRLPVAGGGTATAAELRLPTLPREEP
jgi:hypothetical protein